MVSQPILKWNCNDLSAEILPADITAALAALPSGTDVCLDGHPYEWQRTTSYNGSRLLYGNLTQCPIRAVALWGGVGPYIEPGGLYRGIAFAVFPWSDDDLRTMVRLGDRECTTALPPGPDDEEPDTPPIPPELPPGLPESCCANLGDALDRIADVLEGLKKPCESEIFDCNRIADECIDKIVDKVCERTGKCKKTCDECCADVKSGLAFSSEDAASCAECACEESKKECSIAGLQPGERCEQCGEEPCCCSEDYTCEPCEEGPDKKKYVGWCNTVSGTVIVLAEGKSPPDPVGQWQQASVSDDESQAIRDAQAYCPEKPDTKPPPSIPGFTPGRVNPFCSLNDLLSVGGVGGLLGNIDVQTKGIEYEQFMRAWAEDQSSQASSIPIVGPLIGALLVETIGPLAGIDKLAPNIRNILGCGSPIFDQVLRGLTAVGLYGKWSGAQLGEFADTLYYIANAACRRKHLDPDKAIAAWLGDSLDNDALDSHWAIAGYCPEALVAYKKAAHSKPLPNDLIAMRYRGIISDSDYYRQMREIGYTVATDVDHLYERAKVLPTLSDIIQFMVRDADDETAEGPVKRFNLDAKFSDKYADQLKKWSEQQGIDEKIARYAWRSHWTIPPPTQLFEFFRRLRHKPGYENIRGDVEAALIQQDILPFWHEHLFEILHPPLTRVDVRRAYNIGEFTEQQVYDAHIDLGYSDANAAALTKFATRLREIDIIGSRFIKQWIRGGRTGESAKQRLLDYGYPADVVAKAMAEGAQGFVSSPEAKAFIRGEISSARLREILVGDLVPLDVANRIIGNLSYVANSPETTTLYRAGIITFADAMIRLTNFGIADARAITLLNEIDAGVDAAGASLCRRAISQRVRRGEITAEQSAAEFVKVGIVPERAAKLAKWLGCSQGVGSKTVAVGKLCDLMGQGAINGADFVDRLGRIGYDEHDRHLLLFDCTSRLNLRAQQQVRREAQQQAADQTAQQRKIDKANAAVQRQRNEMERARKAAATTRANRQKQLLSAADKIIRKCDCAVADAVSYVTALRDGLRDEFALTIDESLIAVLLAVEAWDGVSFDNLSEIGRANAQLAVDSALAVQSNGQSG